jgi:hypothetical protein
MLEVNTSVGSHTVRVDCVGGRCENHRAMLIKKRYEVCSRWIPITRYLSEIFEYFSWDEDLNGSPAPFHGNHESVMRVEARRPA